MSLNGLRSVRVMEHGNSSPSRVGPEEEKCEVSDSKALMVLPAGEGRNEGESGRGRPGSGAAAAEGEGAEELSREGSAAAGASGLMGNRSQEDNGATGCDLENEKQPAEPVLKDAVGTEDVPAAPALPMPVSVSNIQPMPALVPRSRLHRRRRHPHNRHSEEEELEGVFQRNHHLSSEDRDGLRRGRSSSAEDRVSQG